MIKRFFQMLREWKRGPVKQAVPTVAPTVAAPYRGRLAGGYSIGVGCGAAVGGPVRIHK
jgi:hypothetical protein